MRAFLDWLTDRAGVIILVVAALVVGYWVGRPPAHEPAEQAADPTAQAREWWTCSMHPQIIQPRKGQCPICFMDLIPMKSDPGGGGPRTLTLSDAARTLLDIETRPVERRLVEARVRMSGRVEYDETRLAYITARVAGRIDRLFVDYTGVSVSKGEHLAELYSPELLTTQEELIQALRGVRAAAGGTSDVVRQMAEATLRATREKLRLLGFGLAQIQEIETQEKPMDHVTIHAPLGGIVIDKNVKQGMYVEMGTRIYTIADLSRVWVRLDAYESDLPWVRPGQPVQFTTAAYPGETFEGHIAFVSPVVDSRTRTVEARVTVPNPDGRLKPGMLVRAVVQATVAAGGRVVSRTLAGKWLCSMHPHVVKDASGKCDECEMPLVRAESLGYVAVDPDSAERPLVIPISAPLVTGTRAVVYIETGHGVFEGREIVLGPRAGDYYVVHHGLAEGERVVTRGQFKLDAELQIQARPSMMSWEAGTSGAAAALEAPPLARPQMQAVLRAAGELAAAAQAEDLAAVHRAFVALGGAVRAVPLDRFTGAAAGWWREYAMLLENDAVEGAAAPTLADARRVADEAVRHAATMGGAFGLPLDDRPAPAVDPQFRRQLDSFVQAYLALQKSLADDEPPEKTAELARAARTVLYQVDAKRVAGPARDEWIRRSAEMGPALERLAEAKDIEAARKEFQPLSDALIAAVRALGNPCAAAMYVTHCPMAFNNAGAHWLQDQEQVLNPYFGARMLRCGAVKEVLGSRNEKKEAPRE